MPKQVKPELKVLMVFSVLGIGGAETWLIALLKYFNQVKDELQVKLSFDIYLTGGKKGALDEEAVSLGARLYYMQYSRSNLFSFIHSLRKLLKQGHYDVIHDHQDYTAGLHFLMGIGYLPKLRIVHIHNPLTHIQNYSSGAIRRLTLFTGKKLIKQIATHIMGTSRQIVTEYGFDTNAFDKINRGAIYCGFDVKNFFRNSDLAHIDLCNEFGFNKQNKILLFVGRLSSGINHKTNQKNPEFAIEVARKCIEIDPDIRMLMAGSGEAMRKKLENRIMGWGLQDKIKLLGSRNDVPRLMSGSDLLLFPSISEGLGMVAVEAQAANLRVLASDYVPRECEVVPGLVKFISLDAGSLVWAVEAVKIIALPKPEQSLSNQLVKISQFSIENSANHLLNLYLTK